MRRFPSSWSSTLSTLGFKRKKNRRGSHMVVRSRRGSIERLEDRRMMAVYTVNSLLDNTTSGDGLTTLREAVAAANSNPGADTIQFDSSLTQSGPATIGLSLGALTIDDDLTINGSGRDLLTIDAQGNSRVFMVAAGVEANISGLTITGGYSNGGGGVYTFGDLTLDSVRVEGNNVATGGGYPGRGGGIYVYGTLTLESSIVNGNSADDIGGGIYVNDTAYATIHNSTIDDNEAYTGGGIFGLLDAGERLLVDSSTISNNRAAGTSGAGGGLFIQSASSSATCIATIVNSTISNNTAAYSGGIRLMFSNAHLDIREPPQRVAR